MWAVKLPYYFPDEGPDVNIDEPSDDDDDNDNDEEEDDQDEDDEDKDDDEDKEGKDTKGSKDDEEIILSRVSYSEIKEKFPEFFKTFPDLKHAFFREQQFTEIFPTIEDAKRAAEKELAYEEITSSVVDGDAARFITELTKESEEGLEKFAKNFFPALREENKDLFFDSVAPLVQGFVRDVFGVGLRDKDDNIKNAAKIVHKILFGGDYNDVEKDVPIADRGSRNGKDKSSIDKDKDQYITKKYQDLYNEVTTGCYTALEAEIAKGLDDLKKSRPGLVKIITKDIKDRVLADMQKDTAYMGRMQSLWKREQRTGFNGSLKSSFNTTFIAKAKALVPKYRSEVRREVLGKENLNGNNNNKDDKDPTRLSGNRNSKNSGKGKMSPERQRAEKLNTRQVFEG
jgi:hypothetical protein